MAPITPYGGTVFIMSIPRCCRSIIAPILAFISVQMASEANAFGAACPMIPIDKFGNSKNTRCTLPVLKSIDDRNRNRGSVP